MPRDKFTRRSVLALGATGAVAAAVPEAAAAALPAITDAAGHAMPYAWRPATDPANAPFVVVLHGAQGGKAAPNPARDPNWNVLVPLDQYGPNGDGSWWVGERGDDFTLQLLHRLVRGKRRGTRSTRPLYVVGGSMGGYGALLHGMLLGARAVSAVSFQSILSRHENSIMQHVLPSPYERLANVLRNTDHRPMFFLGFNRFDHYFDGHFPPFLAACVETGANFAADIRPVSGHTFGRSFAQSLALFGSLG